MPWDNQVFADIDSLLAWLEHERALWNSSAERAIQDRPSGWALDLRPTGDDVVNIYGLFLTATAVHVSYSWGTGIGPKREEFHYAR